MRMLTLDELIDRYEAALAKSHWNVVDLRQYIPSASNTEYWPALVELLRIRMEHAFPEDASQGLEQCIREFPGLLQKSDLLSELAYEEFRLRQSAGHSVTAQEYHDRWDVDTSKWKRASSDADSSAGSDIGSSSSTGRKSAAEINLVAGETFGPFRILCLLGRGALAKVYLAQQLDLSERAVVLKVCAQATLEPQKIALLQHPHIVQIFSAHEVSGYQVLCMPYAGATTLADLLASYRIDASSTGDAATRTSQQLVTTLSNRQREIQTLVDNSPVVQRAQGIQLNHGLRWPERWQSMRYEDIVCELILQLAEGLAHAHHHGITHSDLKPANVLIGDDGEARLVDFNVAQREGDTRRSLMGGTLPYMAPEHIRSMREDRWSAGAQSDLYSLGIIAFQMLSGKLPFATPGGSSNEALDQCLAEREQRRFSYQLTSQHASSDVRSIIDKLLEPKLELRYQSAAQLAEDLQRHLSNLPLLHAANKSVAQRLSKWSRRHPRLSSATTVISLSTAAMLLMATTLINYRIQFRTEQAKQLVAQFRSELPTALIMAAHYQQYGDMAKPAVESATTLLENLTEPNSDKPRVAFDYLTPSDKALLATNLQELSKTLKPTAAQNASAAPTELIGLSQSAQTLADRLQRSQERDALIQTAVDVDFRDLTLATQAYTQGDLSKAITLLTSLVERSPHQHAAWLLLGICHQNSGNTELADVAYATNLALMPKHWQAWYYRGQLLQASAEHSHRLDQLKSAEAHYTRALELKPDLTSAIFNRALCRETLGNFDQALADAETLIEKSTELVRAHFLAARVLQKKGQTTAAEEHTRQAMAAPPACQRDYVYLGTAQLASNPATALSNLRHAWEMNPHDPEALQSLAYVAMELKIDADAQRWLDQWAAAAPYQAAPVASRAVYHARLGRLETAYADCQKALALHPQPRERAQIASALVLIAEKTDSDDNKRKYITQALTLLAQAIQSDWRLVAEVAQDSDIKSLRGDNRFQALINAAIAFARLPKLVESPTQEKP